MKRLLAVLLIVVVFLLCGCNAKQDSIEEKRFVVEYSQWGTPYIVIIRDTKTGVAYLFSRSGYGGGLTRLEEVQEIDNG